MSDDDTTPEHWTYKGVRTGKGGKLIHCWDDGTGDDVHYEKLRGTAIGGTYQVDVVDRGASLTVRPPARYLGMSRDDDTQVALWQVQDRDARDADQLRKAEQRQAKNPELELALKPLLAIVAQCRTRFDATSLSRIVSDRITEEYYKR